MRKVRLAGVFIAQGAIELIVNFRCAMRHPLACVVPSGICLSKFFENTRDFSLGARNLVSARLPKNF
jgi:hypothetical protein